MYTADKVSPHFLQSRFDNYVTTIFCLSIVIIIRHNPLFSNYSFHTTQFN